jgi:hypothetical protein
MLLIAYTAILGLLALRHQSPIDAVPKTHEPIAADPYRRGELAGYRVGRWIRSIGWLVAATLLFTGRSWAITVVAVAYFFSAQRSYSKFAQGFAEGRKAGELAAAPEYVRGRIAPRARDRVAAVVYVTLTRLLPLGATLVALTWIGR